MKKLFNNLHAVTATLVLLLAASTTACMDNSVPSDDSFGQVQKSVEVECVKYAEPNGNENANCTSWENACDPQTAIDEAQSAGEGCEVWVKKGTHKVYKTSRTDYIEMYNYTYLYGGFDGDENQTVEDRNERRNKTVLHGNKDGDDDCNPTSDCVKRILHINDHDVIIDGFIIQYGYNDGGTFGNSGAFTISGNSYNVTINNCDIMHNYGYNQAGAVNIADDAYAILIKDTVFYQNESVVFGGALRIGETGNQGEGASYCEPHNYWDKCVNLENVHFTDNLSGDGGAILMGAGAAVFFDKCTFTINYAQGGGTSGGYGGAISIKTVTDDINWRIENSLFQENTAYDPVYTSMGGAIYVLGDGEGYLVNSTIVKNTADLGYGCAVASHTFSYPTVYIYNSILWNSDCIPGAGAPSELYGQTNPDTFVLDHVLMHDPPEEYCISCLNSDSYPIEFTDPANDNYSLAPGSSAVDWGDDNEAPTLDYEGYGRVDHLIGGAKSDLGYLESTHKAQGDSCTSNSQCANNICTDGYCCNSTCTFTCHSCAISGSEGVCSAFADQTDPEQDCSLCYVCNGSSSCVLPDHDWPSYYDPRCGAYRCTWTGSCVTGCFDNNWCAPEASCYRGSCSF